MSNEAPQQTLKQPVQPPMQIELQNVKKVYPVTGGEVVALDNISLKIRKGDIFGIIGLSGAGKSTLIRCINRLDTPTEGKILIDGQNVPDMNKQQLRQMRRKVSMIFQQFNLLMQQTVAKNIAYPMECIGVPRAKINARVKELLEVVGLESKAKAYPAQLSGGQRQRVAIARALASDPEVLLCDEATSALDPMTTQAILRLLQKINREMGITIVVITHEMAVVKEICHRVAVMEHGKVVESGEVFNIFANPREDITKNFIHTTSNLRKIEELIAEDSPVVKLNPGELIVRLSYIQRNVSEPLISTVSRKFDIVLNIIFSDIAIVQNAPIGGTVAIISGSRDQITQAIAYLSEKNVGVEVIKDARVSE